MSALEGKRILIVDDEALIALHTEDILLELGATPVGPATTVKEAIALIELGGLDAAILDVNLNGTTSEFLARRLHQDGIPYIVATGYGRVDWQGLDPTVLAKPYDASAIARALGATLAVGRAEPSPTGPARPA